MSIIKHLYKYLILSTAYVLSVLLAEYFPNIITGGIWFIILIICFVSFIRLLLGKQYLINKLLPIVIMLIPLFDVAFGITHKIRNAVKGDIVLSIIDDSFATTKSLTIREKNEELAAYYNSSVAGFGDEEKAKIEILNDSTFTFKLIERDYSEVLIYDSQKQNFCSNDRNRCYRVLRNDLFK